MTNVDLFNALLAVASLVLILFSDKKSFKREAKKGPGDGFPRLGVWGMKSPNVPLSRSDSRKKQSGSEALPDGR